MSHQGWCLRHQDRLHEAKDARFAAELLVVKRAMQTGQLPGGNGCWACPLSENDFQAALREAGTLVAKTEAYGGTYTAPGIAISIGGRKDDVS